MQTHRQLLEHAANLAEDARKRLDTRTSRCSFCGLTHYVKRDHWKQAQELDGIIKKLKRLASFDPPP